MYHKPFGGRALPGPPGGAYNAPPDPLAGLRGWDPPGRGKAKEMEGEKGGIEPNFDSRFGG